MSETTVEPRPGVVALSLIRTIALDEAAHSAAGSREQAPPNWSVYRDLTERLETWKAAGTLRENGLLTVEWLAVDLIAYRFQALGENKGKLDQWLNDFGDQVCRSQRHAHPAGPTAMTLLSVVAEDVGPGLRGNDAVRVAQLAVPYQGYVRPDQEVEDTRELALTLGLWAGPLLASLMHYESDRITGYLDSRAVEAGGTNEGTN
ncbi:hypothetical protein [Streptomyces sp. PsTaAH-124]|uniref:hypothetical protein n=1 Tax=Streptomyces sp. PsTaAH-124 TaxID=1157638 RepID=UPI00037895CD|nr:hypothetical protein [Streptomyces sp. PsTaAH-124]